MLGTSSEDEDLQKEQTALNKTQTVDKACHAMQTDAELVLS